jgi:hypothetical protein
MQSDLSFYETSWATGPQSLCVEEAAWLEDADDVKTFGARAARRGAKNAPNTASRQGCQIGEMVGSGGVDRRGCAPARVPSIGPAHLERMRTPRASSARLLSCA